jgi:molybdenum cofactor cytidylyltransferase
MRNAPLGDAASRAERVIVALLLAAGASRRFGGGLQKLTQELDGKPVVRWSAESLVGSPVDEVLVVVGNTGGPVRDALRGLECRFVENAKADEGMASSVSAGVGALAPEVEAALVVLGDEPLAGREPVARVVERYRRGGASVVAPLFRGVRGHPVLFARSVFPELLALAGDRGARAVADRDPARLALVDLDLPKPVDVDTAADLARLRR